MHFTLKRKHIYNLLLFLIVLTSVLSYEYTIYRNYYQLALLIVFLLGAFSFLISMTQKELLFYYIKIIKNNLLVHLLAIVLLISTLSTSIKLGLVTMQSLFMIILTITSIYIFYLFIPIIMLKELNNQIKKICGIITFFSIIGIIVAVKGSFLGYTPTHYPRVASIFFDPNYFGTMCAVAVLISIYINDSKYKLFTIVNLVALYYSGSRGAAISLFLVIIMLYFYRKKLNFKTLLLFFITCFLVYEFIIFMDLVSFFRVHQGLSARDFLWGISFELIINEPLFGYGYGAVGDIIKAQGALNASSHNAYIDFMLMYGIPAFLLYSMIIAKGLYIGIKNNVPRYLIGSVLLLLINANSISINVGGLGALSLLLTLFLGICNSYNIYNKYIYNNSLDK